MSMRSAEAIELGRVLRQYRPYFYEDPIPDNLEAMRQVIRCCEIPVAIWHKTRLWRIWGSWYFYIFHQYDCQNTSGHFTDTSHIVVVGQDGT